MVNEIDQLRSSLDDSRHVGTIPGQTGGILQQTEVQYVAHRDQYGVWRILDQWSSSLQFLSPDDDVPDDNEAVTLITEGKFHALMKAAIQVGAIPQLRSMGAGEVPVEDLAQLAELTEENSTLKRVNKILEMEIEGLKNSQNIPPPQPEVPRSEDSHLKLEAMNLIASLAKHGKSIDSIKDLVGD